MSTTTRNSYPAPDGGDSVAIPTDMKALADAIDQVTPYASDTEPDPAPDNLLWWEPTDQNLHVRVSSAWQDIIKGSSGQLRIGPILIQWGSTVKSTNSSGGLTENITFPTAYSTAPLVVPSSGDSGHCVQVAIWNGAIHPGDFDVICFRADGSAAANTNVRINWVAIGLA